MHMLKIINYLQNTHLFLILLLILFLPFDLIQNTFNQIDNKMPYFRLQPLKNNWKVLKCRIYLPYSLHSKTDTIILPIHAVFGITFLSLGWSLFKKRNKCVMVNIAFVVFIDGQDTLCKIYVYQPPCNNNPYTFTGWWCIKM